MLKKEGRGASHALSIVVESPRFLREIRVFMYRSKGRHVGFMIGTYSHYRRNFTDKLQHKTEEIDVLQIKIKR